MTRIGPTGGPKRPNRPDGAGRAEGVGKAKGKDFAQGLSGPAAADAAKSFQPGDATYQRMRSRIEGGLAKGWSQDEILADVIKGELDEFLGGEASPEVAQSVSQAFQDNGQLQSLFNQVLARVRQGG